MSARYPLLIKSVQILAALIAFFGLCFPEMLQSAQLWLAVGLIVLIGIPHGATDYIIFQYLSKPFLGTESLFNFYRNYILIMGAYAFLWWISPLLSLGIFLGLSIYHFGQSNWNYLNNTSKFVRIGLYLVWGTFVLLTPILLHYEEASGILTQILGFQPAPISKTWRWAMVFFLFAHSVYLCLYLRAEELISRQQFQNELVNLVLLFLVYSLTPLLLGFAIYFVFWHSLGSVMDQITFFKKRVRDYDLKNYIQHALPISLIALATLGGLVWYQGNIGIHADLGAMFMFISVVTLPHMLLIEKLYEEWENKEEPAVLIQEQGYI